jgi:hypothetical protein
LHHATYADTVAHKWLREATNQRKESDMRALRFDFHPDQIRISSDEILADLRYPARVSSDDGGRKRKARVRRVREAQPV